MTLSPFYPIGITGKRWGEPEILAWRNKAHIQRSYQNDVVQRLLNLKDRYSVSRYGVLSINPERYPLYYLKNKSWDAIRPIILITSGIHGYETSGVSGALQFLETRSEDYLDQFNVLCIPCISPWSYETINRWNPLALDPNRSCYTNSPCEESSHLIRLVSVYAQQILAHFDLHETTQSDESEFRPALSAKEGKAHVPGQVPDGFYLIGHTENPQRPFQAAIIEAVKQITHIAPPDKEGKIIGTTVVQEGLILYAMKALGLCGGITNCRYHTTTEVYPDSPRVTPQQCNDAQVAAITGGLDFILQQ